MQVELEKQEIQKILDIIDAHVEAQYNFIPEDLKKLIDYLSEVIG